MPLFFPLRQQIFLFSYCEVLGILEYLADECLSFFLNTFIGVKLLYSVLVSAL